MMCAFLQFSGEADVGFQNMANAEMQELQNEVIVLWATFSTALLLCLGLICCLWPRPRRGRIKNDNKPASECLCHCSLQMFLMKSS